MEAGRRATHGDEALAVMSFPRGVPFIVILTSAQRQTRYISLRTPGLEH